jgi:hypothetical protein
MLVLEKAMIIGVAAMLLPIVAQAHGGRLDGAGCHHDSRDGRYHCHAGPLLGATFASKAAVAVRLGIATSPGSPNSCDTSSKRSPAVRTANLDKARPV